MMMDLTDTTWTFKEIVSIPSTREDYSIDFSDGSGTSYESLSIYRMSGSGVIVTTHCIDYGSTKVYSSVRGFINGWTNSKCQTITITGGADAINANLIRWFELNAYQTEIKVTFRDETITSFGTDGTKTLTTSGKYCEDDITIEYARIAGSAETPATTITANPIISVDANGLITSSVSSSESVTPTVSAGYVSSGTAGTITVSGSNTSQLTTQSGSTIAPTESEQIAVASGKYTTGNVKIGAISPTYIGSGITQRDSTDLTESGATVSVPSGYYAETASKSVASGTEGTPTATKGTVSNNSVQVTPSVTNTAGYISGGTHTGTSVTVSASELVSGTISISSSGTTDVTNYANASVAAGSATTPATTVTANPIISVGSTGLITASVNGTQSVTPTVSAGYVSTGTAGTITVSGSNISQLTVYNGEKHDGSLMSSFIVVFPYLPEQSRNYVYQLEQGMTWAQWCASAYNKNGFYIQGSYVYEEYGTYYVLNASPSSVIENEAIYSLTTT